MTGGRPCLTFTGYPSDLHLEDTHAVPWDVQKASSPRKSGV